MYNPESFLLNEMRKLLWNFEIQTDHLISARWPDLVIITKKKKKKKKERTCRIVDFSVLSDHRIKLKESEKKDKYLDLARELKKLWNMKVTVIPIVIAALGTVTKETGTITGGLGNKSMNGDHPNYSIAEIGQNIEKSHGDLKRLAVPQTPVGNHRLMLVWKNSIRSQ